MTWKSYAAASGATLVATYLFSTPPAVVPERPSASTAVSRAAEPAVDIREEAARLQARVRQDTEYTEPSRNPFRFGSDPAPPRTRARAPQAVVEPSIPPAAEPPPPPPLVRLSGIATNTVDGVRERRAVLVTERGVVTVREGDAVGTEYRVARIEADAVELVATDGTTRRLSLRP